MKDETGFSNPLSRIERRMLDELNLAVYEANPLNAALRHCRIGAVRINKPTDSTFHHPV